MEVLYWVGGSFLSILTVAWIANKFTRRDVNKSSKPPAWIFYREDRQPVKKFGNERGYWTRDWKPGDWTLGLKDE